MATTVTGLTAERMLAIEAGSVIDGQVVGDNLILTKHDGSTIDAGSVRGQTNYQRIAYKTVDELPNTYPLGASTFSIGAETGWPTIYATVFTIIENLTTRGFQFVVEKTTGRIWTRVIGTINSVDNNWMPFTELSTTADASAYSDARLVDAKAYTDQAEADANAYSDARLIDAKAYTDQEVDKVSTSIGTADLDTLLTPGRYVQTSDAEATAARHYPELRAGHLEVLGTNPGAWDMLLHRYTVYETDNPAVWVRTRYNQVWGAWKLAMKDAPIADPISPVGNFTAAGRVLLETLPNGKRKLTTHFRITRVTSNLGVLPVGSWLSLGTFIPATHRIASAGYVYFNGWVTALNNTSPVSFYLDTSTGALSVRGYDGLSTIDSVIDIRVNDFFTVFLTVIEG